MTFVKIPARNYKVYIEDPATADRFVRIHGLESIGLAPSAEESADTDFDSEGYEEVEIVQRGLEITLEGKEKVDLATGEYQEGQALVNALADKVGSESKGTLRVVHPSGTTKEHTVIVTPSELGGGLNDKSTWGATFKRSGKSTVIASGDLATYVE